MSSAIRLRRIERNHKRLAQQPRLNLVALMDIFTILVLFLMVNNGDVEVLQANRDITLPESVSEQRPEIALTVLVGAGNIVVQGRRVEKIEEALAQQSDILPGLEQELQYQIARSAPLPEMAQDEDRGRSVIVMGDKGVSYKLLKRIMTTCAQSGYRDISLAVNSKPPPFEGEDGSLPTEEETPWSP